MAEEKIYQKFVTAARNGDLPTIQRMLTGENPVAVDVESLFRACHYGHSVIVQELLRAGADVNWKRRGWNAACYYRKRPESPEVVEALLAAGADVDATDYDGDTPLMYLVRSSEPITSQLTIARLLLAANCDVNQESQDGDTALVVACRRHNSNELVRWLLEHGARVTPKAWFACVDSYASTIAIKVSCLLEHGMDVNATDAKGRTAMHWAARKRNTDLVRLLLDRNANVSIQDGSGRTALMEACLHISRENEIPIIRMLLERMKTVDKELIDIPDFCGYTALYFAARNDYWRVLDELLNWEPNLLCQTGDTSITPLHFCVIYQWCDESIRYKNLQCLVEHTNGYGQNGVNIQDKGGRTTLHLALELAGRNTSVIDYLSTKVDVSIQDVEGNTSLHIAVKCNQSESMVEMLLRSSHATEAANTRNGLGWTPLHQAAFLSNANIVHAIGYIADVNIRSHDGKTALHYAATERATSCMEILLTLNANVSIRDNDGNTALMLTCNNCDDDDENPSLLTMILELYKGGVAYGEV